MSAQPETVEALKGALARAGLAMREAEERHEAELRQERETREVYLRVWIRRERLAALGSFTPPPEAFPAPGLVIAREELEEAGQEAQRAGWGLSYEIEPDGQGLRIRAAERPEKAGA